MALLKSTNIIGNLSATGNIIASKFILNGGDNNSLLLAGGNTKLISDFATAEQMAAANTSITNLSNGKVSKAGDTMTGLLNAHGGITLNSSTAEANSPPYILGIKAFAEGGNITWSARGNVSVGHADIATNATTAGTTFTNSIGGDSHALALKSYFDNNKTTAPRNKLLSFYSSAYGNGSQCMGYFLNGYDSTPYGGFFVAHYNSPKYVGIQDGAYTEWELSKVGHTHSYLPLAGGTMTGKLTANNGLEWTDADWIPGGNINCKPTAHNNEWSFDIYDSTYTNAMWHIYSLKAQSSILQCIAAPEYKVNIPHGKLGLGSANFQYNTSDKCIDVIFN